MKKQTLAVKPQDEWRVESDLNTLLEAAKIRKDPKRWAMVQELAKQRLAPVAEIAGGDAE